MKKIFILFIVTFYSYSQEKIVIADNNLKATFRLTKSDSLLYQEIQNVTDDYIFIPKVNSNFSVYNYIIEDNLYIFFGIVNSLNGSPSLDGIIELIKISPKDVYTEKKIIKSNKTINNFILSIDYILESKKIKNNNLIYWISTEKYLKQNKYLITKVIGHLPN